MSGRYLHLGWRVSPYSAKTRAGLRFKGVAFDDVEPSALTLLVRVRRAVGRPIMPTLIAPDGTWLQDSSDILDAIEERFPEPAFVPPGPRQRLVSALLELHGDEWLTLPAMHYRWNLPANADFAIGEFARSGFPWLPRSLGRRAVRPISGKMAGYRPILGIDEATAAGIERFTRELIQRLEAHLAEQPFLLGGRPCIGDLALFGPLWAHLYRDPASTALFADTPHLCDWFERLQNPSGAPGDFLPDDAVPDTLAPILRTLFAEQGAFVRDLVAAIDRWCDAHPDATRVPRSLGDHPFVVGGVQGTRRLVTFVQWKAQRPLATYAALDEAERAAVDPWLEELGGLELLRTPVRHPFTRVGFEARLARPTG